MSNKWIINGDHIVATCCGKVFNMNQFEKDPLFLGKDITKIYVPKKCPNCGAKMEIDQVCLMADTLN